MLTEFTMTSVAAGSAALMSNPLLFSMLLTPRFPAAGSVARSADALALSRAADAAGSSGRSASARPESIGSELLSQY
jgi:hypothetical protein